MHLRSVPGVFILSILLTVTPFAAAISCEEAVGGFSRAEFQRKINRAYRQTVSFKEALGLSAEHGIGFFRPFKVTEISEFFPKGELPSVAKLDEVRVIRADRETGIRELRKSVTMNEERGWIFLPSMNLWIYNSIVSADMRNTNGNGLLSKTLERLFGEFETYHNHPSAAVKINYEEYRMADSGYSFEQYRPFIAVPTGADLMNLVRYIDLRKKQSFSTITGHVVSEFGITSYRMRAFPYHNGQRDTGIYPAITVSAHHDVLKEGLPPRPTIRKLLFLASESSTEQVSCMEDVCHWTPDAAPKFLFEFKPW